MKLDVQGFELEVLLGGVGALRSTRAIIAEVSAVSISWSPISLSGFFVYALGHSTALERPFLQCDVLFLGNES